MRKSALQRSKFSSTAPGRSQPGAPRAGVHTQRQVSPVRAAQAVGCSVGSSVVRVCRAPGSGSAPIQPAPSVLGHSWGPQSTRCGPRCTPAQPCSHPSRCGVSVLSRSKDSQQRPLQGSRLRCGLVMQVTHFAVGDCLLSCAVLHYLFLCYYSPQTVPHLLAYLHA